MRRLLPSTAALAAFEAAARHQSFTRAAEELALTQSAVCRQVAGLEDFLGVKLFRRSRRGVVLTEAGASYSASVRTRLDEFERDTLAVRARGGTGGALELGVVPTFATKWLLPRLKTFQQEHPGITLHMAPRTRPFLFADSGLDAAIHAGAGAWPGTEARLLLPENLIPVASPALVAPRRRLRAAQVARLPLLQPSTRPYAWRQWFASQGLQVADDMAGSRMELFSMIAEAAVQGLGVALVPRLLVEQELASGALIQLVDHALCSDRAYHLIYPEAKAELPALVALRAWLEREAARYRREAGLDQPARARSERDPRPVSSRP